MRAPGPVLVLLFLAASILAGCIGATPEGAPTDAADPVPAPINGTIDGETFHGRLVCGLGTPAGTLNPCFVSSDSDNVFPYSVREDLQTLLVGMTWDPTTTLGEQLQISVETRGFGVVGQDDAHRYATESGRPDLVIRIDRDANENGRWSWENISGSMELQSRVFPARSMPPSAILDQPFEIHVLAFYGVPAPEGANPFADEGTGTA